jgi:hypothetical protein
MKLPVALLVLAACGDVLDAGEAHSGRRLKLGWYVYPGGARERETGWYYDALLGERCVARTWSDGQRYCSPPADEAVYVNDTCTRAVGRTFVGLPPSPFFATTFAVGGEPVPRPSRLFRRGPPTLPPPAIWQKGLDGCVPREPGDSFEYFELGEEIATSELVHLRRSEPTGTGELARIDETTDDGLRVPVALYDRAAASECKTIDRPNAAAVDCVAVSALPAPYFHDPACNEPVVAAPPDLRPTRAIQYDVSTSCWNYFAVGDEVSARPIYELGGANCVETAAPSGARLFGMAGTIAMPTLTRERDPSNERLRPIARVAAGLRVPDELLYDAELDAECRHDASLRCVPRTEAMVATAESLRYYSDPQCLSAISLAFVASGACDPPVRFGRDGDVYYPLEAPYTAPIYVPSTGDTCSQYAVPTPLVAYTVGAPLDPSAFAVGELAIDP